jgi:hypothetical protein
MNSQQKIQGTHGVNIDTINSKIGTITWLKSIIDLLDRQRKQCLTITILQKEVENPQPYKLTRKENQNPNRINYEERKWKP